MKIRKKIAAVTLVAAVAVTAGWNFYQNTQEVEMNELALANVEALATCEISSNHNLNTGYCSPMHGGTGDACVASGSGGEPRCSGNY